jgi:hypothetical protein
VRKPKGNSISTAQEVGMRGNFGSRTHWFAFILTFFGVLLISGNAFGQGGACPASSPLAGKNSCYFIAATGSDANSGTSESSPWLHAPGMPNCTGNCASALPSSPNNGNTNGAGLGIIFRGGDTWHEGNSSLSPYTGGTWVWQWGGNPSSCVYEGTVSGCAYLGVDTTWYNSSVCGSSWCRPIISGDNPTSASIVSSCAYQIGTNNALFAFQLNTNYEWDTYLDSFEFTGLCGNSGWVGGTGVKNVYVWDPQGSAGATGIQILNNLYLHGWTTTSITNTDNTVCTVLRGGGTMLWSMSNIVVDGSDSNPSGCMWGYGPSFYHFKDSIIRYTWDGVGQACHDIHDIIFEYLLPSPTGGHSNILECNADATGNYTGQPQNTPNVWYNIVTRHSNSNVGEWVCPNTIPEYWFNMVWYDTQSEGWSMAGSPAYPGCTGAGGQYMFNNTFVDTAPMLCGGAGSNTTGGAYTTSYNNLLINTPWDKTGCTGGPSSSSNVSLTDAQATAKGYTTGVSGTQGLGNTCANETTTPCSPTSSSAPTVGAGINLANNSTIPAAVATTWCATLASYTTEYAISTEAASACNYGTTDGCSYNSTTHTMNCPGQTPVARPESVAWDSGAYQLAGGGGQPQPPTNVQATGH